MNKIIRAAVLFWLLVQALAAQTCNYLVWSDEFDSNGSPSAANWNYETGGGGWGNNELQTYTNSTNNAYVQNGLLNVRAVKNNGTWTSARMVTAGKASWKYGRIEVRAKLPAGVGTWPAIWMMPASSVYGGWPKSGEIDIMEHVGYDMNRIHGSAHSEAYYHKIGTQKSGNIVMTSVDKNFYTYAIEWTPETIKWYVDNTLYFTVYNEHKTYKEWPFDQPFFLILNVAIGGDWGGAQGVDANLSEAIMQVDYVKVYSNALPVPAVTGASTAKPGDLITFTTGNVSAANITWTVPTDATIVSGQGTPEVTVKWGTNSGNVSVKLTSDCETQTSAPLAVQTLTTPTGTSYTIPFATDAYIWKVMPATGNTTTLTPGTALNVNYQVTNTNTNPNIYCDLPSTTDFTAYRTMEITIKPISGSVPSNLRIDMEDINGKINLKDLFKVDAVENTSSTKVYTYTFGNTGTNTDGWLLSKIKTIRIYYNYGLFGRTGSGEFNIESMVMKNPNLTIGSSKAADRISVFPNPATNTLTITAATAIDHIVIYSPAGQTLIEYQPIATTQNINITQWHGGIYIAKIWTKGKISTTKFTKR